ncbi:MAG: TonB-dependent receptor, partial [Candidatus Neomarinimicrobiota bacterium]
VTSEEVWTYELGYSGFIGRKVRATFDLYYSTYSDFVSDLTWVSPVVLDTSAGFYAIDNPDPDILGIIPVAEHSGIIDGGDGIPGSYWISYGADGWDDIPAGWWDRPAEARQGTTVEVVGIDTIGAWWTDDKVDFGRPVELNLTNINYGQISLWGFDASLYAFITRSITADLNLSYLGKTGFYNFLTKGIDPINAPQFKINGQLAYNTDLGFSGNLGFRYIPEFDWSAGVHFGTIPTYLVLDGMLAYKFDRRYSLLLNINNISGNMHREIIGGPEMGRHVTLKLNVKL